MDSTIIVNAPTEMTLLNKVIRAIATGDSKAPHLEYEDVSLYRMKKWEGDLICRLPSENGKATKWALTDKGENYWIALQSEALIVPAMWEHDIDALGFYLEYGDVTEALKHIPVLLRTWELSGDDDKIIRVLIMLEKTGNMFANLILITYKGGDVITYPSSLSKGKGESSMVSCYFTKNGQDAIDDTLRYLEDKNLRLQVNSPPSTASAIEMLVLLGYQAFSKNRDDILF